MAHFTANSDTELFLLRSGTMQAINSSSNQNEIWIFPLVPMKTRQVRKILLQFPLSRRLTLYHLATLLGVFRYRRSKPQLEPDRASRTRLGIVLQLLISVQPGGADLQDEGRKRGSAVLPDRRDG